jgi:ribosomal protein S18 acetylase RimI-like enzyme
MLRSDRAVLEECDVGHRVVVRRTVGSGPHQTDVLGELMALNTERLIVRTDDGGELAIPVATITAAKRVPPRPVRYSEIAALELTAQRCWPAPDCERLGDWYLRAAEGWTNRANSVLPIGDPGRSLPEALDACREWYAHRSLPTKITVPLPVRRDVGRALSAAGWIRQPPVLVQTASAQGLAAGAESQATLHPEPSDDFLAIVAARKASLPPAARAVLLGAPARFAEVREDGTLLAIARGAVVDRWLHLSVVEVLPPARRRGYAVDLSRALARWAVGEGATRALLQVEEHNTAAIRLYARLGFTTHHTYETFRQD